MSDYPTESIEQYALSKKDRPRHLFSEIGIIGCGVVGRAITLMASQNGIDVVFVEVTKEKIQDSVQELEKMLDHQIDHWGMTTGEKKLVLSRIRGTTDYRDLRKCDLVIESIKSKTDDHLMELRKTIFKKVEEQVDHHCIIATSSTSSIVTELSSVLEHNERTIGIHFLITNPNARVVEVIKGHHTSKDVFTSTEKFVRMINKTPLLVEESPGLVSVRIVASFINEACDVLMEGVSTRENIDLTMRNYFGLILGPFELADKIGLDKIQNWMDDIYNEFGFIKYKTSPLIRRLVRAGYLGRKTQQGFYTYDANGNRASKQAELYIADYGF